MREITIDIDGKSPAEIRDTLRKAGLSSGDHVKLVHAARTAFAGFMVLMVVYLFLKMQQALKPFGEKVLDDLFGKYNSEEELEAEIERDYGIKITVESKTDPEHEEWMSMSALEFDRAYTDPLDDYSDVPVKEPNPHYRPWKQGRSSE